MNPFGGLGKHCVRIDNPCGVCCKNPCFLLQIPFFLKKSGIFVLKEKCCTSTYCFHRCTSMTGLHNQGPFQANYCPPAILCAVPGLIKKNVPAFPVSCRHLKCDTYWVSGGVPLLTGGSYSTCQRSEIAYVYSTSIPLMKIKMYMWQNSSALTCRPYFIMPSKVFPKGPFLSVPSPPIPGFCKFCLLGGPAHPPSQLLPPAPLLSRLVGLLCH